MRILGLLNSNAHGGKGDIPRDELFPAAMQAPLTKAIGEQVEVFARAVWPNPGLERVVEKWMNDFQPELVVFPISSFWFLYESTPVRIERRFGSAGLFISKKSQKLAATPWLAHNRPFQWTRKQAQRVIGGQAWFEPGEVIDVAQKVIRSVIRREGTYLVVFGPSGGEKWAQDQAALDRLVKRRESVDHALADFCKLHHVEYWDQEQMASLRDPRGSSLQGDELHLDREGHRRVVEHQFGLSVGLVKRALAATRELATGGTPT